MLELYFNGKQEFSTQTFHFAKLVFLGNNFSKRSEQTAEGFLGRK
jgi:hypothetical protein